MVSKCLHLSLWISSTSYIRNHLGREMEGRIKVLVCCLCEDLAKEKHRILEVETTMQNQGII